MKQNIVNAADENEFIIPSIWGDEPNDQTSYNVVVWTGKWERIKPINFKGIFVAFLKDS